MNTLRRSTQQMMSCLMSHQKRIFDLLPAAEQMCFLQCMLNIAVELFQSIPGSTNQQSRLEILQQWALIASTHSSTLDILLPDADVAFLLRYQPLWLVLSQAVACLFFKWAFVRISVTGDGRVYINVDVRYRVRADPTQLARARQGFTRTRMQQRQPKFIQDEQARRRGEITPVASVVVRGCGNRGGAVGRRRRSPTASASHSAETDNDLQSGVPQ